MASHAASASPVESPEETTTVAGPLMFDQLQRERQATASSSPTTSSEAATGSPSVVDDVGGPADEMAPSAGPTSSRASSVPDPASERMLREVIELGVITAGNVAHGALARDQLDRDLGRWLVSPDEAGAIAGPLASIAQRHGGVGPAGNPDVGDVIAAAIATIAYAGRQVTLWIARRRAAPAPATGPQEGQEAPETGDQG